MSGRLTNMKIDNFEQMEKLLDFSEGTFYKFVLLVRQKDGDNDLLTKGSSKTTVFKTFYVDSWEYYWSHKDIMKKYARATGARVYMCTDKKDCVKLCTSLMTELTKVFKSAIEGNSQAFRYIYKLTDSLTSKDEVSSKSNKMLLFDVDTKDEEVKNEVIEYIKEHEEIPLVLESKNGYHIICRRKFDSSAWRVRIKSKEVELKSNAMCLVYMEEDE